MTLQSLRRSLALGIVLVGSTGLVVQAQMPPTPYLDSLGPTPSEQLTQLQSQQRAIVTELSSIRRELSSIKAKSHSVNERQTERIATLTKRFEDLSQRQQQEPEWISKWAQSQRDEMQKLAAELRALRQDSRQDSTTQTVAKPKVPTQPVPVEVKSMAAVSSAALVSSQPDGFIAHFHLRCGCPANVERRSGQFVLVESHKNGRTNRTQLDIVPSVPANWISMNPVSSGHLLVRDPRMDSYKLVTMTSAVSR